MRKLLVAAALFLGWAIEAVAETKLALIIANQAYSNQVGPLVNPLNDAKIMKAALEAHDFDVQVLADAGRAQILTAVDRFAAELGAAGSNATGFLYYSGHGAAKPNTNRNYIIPVTVADAASASLWFDSVPLEDVRRLLLEGAPDAAHILVFDACRSELQLPNRGSRGFAPVGETVGGMLTAFSASPGQVADDGERGDPAGPYALALAAELDRATRQSAPVTAPNIFGRVRQALNQAGETQRPIYSDGLDRIVSFGGGAPAVAGQEQASALTAAVSTSAGHNEALASDPSHTPKPSSPVDAFRDCSDCPEMVDIPAGSFLMGTPPKEAARGVAEGPQRRVEIGAFAIGAYEITFDDWETCVAESGCDAWLPSDGGWGRGNRPVINVSWKDAQAYVAWLSERTGVDYRLPTEAEWEYAARADEAAAFNTGAQITSDQANFNGRRSYGGAPEGVYLAETTTVGSYPANAFGVFDVHGNVAEWVADCWRSDLSAAPRTGDPAEAALSGDCGQAAVRGGAWRNGAASIRSGARAAAWRDHRADDLGFRVARPAR